MSGSLAKGTAVRGTADIDLVVFVNGIKNITQLGKKSRRKLLQALDSTVRNYPQWRGRLREKKRSRFSRSYYFDGNEVDILPTIDILEMRLDASELRQLANNILQR
nr:hypothetical protein BaRGS_014063 [Batillaria attramentaria]